MESIQTSSKNKIPYYVLNEPIFDFNKLKLLRLSKNKTQEELAVLCDVSASTISSIECGLFVPRLKLFFKICYVLNIEFYEIINIPMPIYIEKTKVL